MNTTSFRKSPFFRYISFIVLTAFVGLLPVQPSFAQVDIVMPPVGQMLHVTGQFEPPQMVGLKIDLKDPFSFGFIMDQGQTPMSDPVKKEEFNKIIKYFLVSLAMPNKDMWVNLSPFESKRVIPEVFGETEMGRDLLAQDYVLKQFTASLMYPEAGLGKKFWDTVYAQAQARFGTTDINVNTFNKVWIVADHADVYQKGDTAFLVGSHLKVMLEQDFKAIEQNKEQFGDVGAVDNTSTDAKTLMASQIVREIILPAIQKEVNEGQSFAAVRQIYNAEIMATWFKKTLRASLLGQVFANQSKIAGQRVSDPQADEKIFQQYLLAYKRGVFNFIKREPTSDGQMVPRRYLSGGAVPVNPTLIVNVPQGNIQTPQELTEEYKTAQTNGQASAWLDQELKTAPNTTPGEIATTIITEPGTADQYTRAKDAAMILLAGTNEQSTGLQTAELASQINAAEREGGSAVIELINERVPNSNEPLSVNAMSNVSRALSQISPDTTINTVGRLTQETPVELAEVKNTASNLQTAAGNNSLLLAQANFEPATEQQASSVEPVVLTPTQIIKTIAETPNVSPSAVASSIASFVGQLTKATAAQEQQLATALNNVQGTEAILATVADHFAAVTPSIGINTPVAPEVAMPIIKEMAATPVMPQVSPVEMGQITDRLTSQINATPNMTPTQIVETIAATPNVSQPAVASSIASFVGQLTRATAAQQQQLATELSNVQGTEAILATVADHFAAVTPSIGINTPVAPEVAMPIIKEMAATPVMPQVSPAEMGQITDRLTSQINATPNMTPTQIVETIAATPNVSQPAVASSIASFVGQLTKATAAQEQQLATALNNVQGTEAILATVADHFAAVTPSIGINTPVAPEVAMPIIKEMAATPVMPQVSPAEMGQITDRLTSQINATPNMTPTQIVETIAATPNVSQPAVASSIASFVGQLTRATAAQQQQLATELSNVQGTEAILATVADHFAAVTPSIGINTPVAPEVAMPIIKEMAATPVMPQVSPAEMGLITERLTNQVESLNNTPIAKPTDVGGINLSDEHLTMNIKVDGAGMPVLPQYQKDALMKLNGLVSIIRSITPITPQNLPALYELAK